MWDIRTDANTLYVLHGLSASAWFSGLSTYNMQQYGLQFTRKTQFWCGADGEMYRGPSRRDWVLIILFISLAFIFLVLTLACQYWSRRLKRKESALEQAASNCDHEEDSYQPRSMNYSIPAVHKGCKYNETMVVLDDV